MSTCKSCGAPIEWAITEKHRRIPLDITPAASGNLVVDGGHARFATPADQGPRRVSHFATCPSANAHRRSK